MQIVWTFVVLKACTSKVKNFVSFLVDGSWGPWSPWATCSVTCGGGVKTRTRECNSPRPQYGGRRCIGKAGDSDSCNKKVCPIGEHKLLCMTHQIYYFETVWQEVKVNLVDWKVRCLTESNCAEKTTFVWQPQLGEVELLVVRVTVNPMN